MADYASGYGVHAIDFQQFTEYCRNLRGNGVISGLTSSVTGTDLIVTIAAGIARANNRIRRFTSSTNVDFTGDPDGANPKKALIVVTSSGTITKRIGTAQVAAPTGQVRRFTYDPDPPTMQAGDIVLVEIWLSANMTAITSSDVSDRRIMTAPLNRDIVRCSEFSDTGTGTNADPWESVAITRAIQYVLDTDPAEREVKIDGGIFRGTSVIDFNTGDPNLSGLHLYGANMGMTGDPGTLGRGSLVEILPSSPTTYPSIYLGSDNIETDHLIVHGFTIKTNGNTNGCLWWRKSYRCSLYDVQTYGNTKVDVDNWAIRLINSWSGNFWSLHPRNCYNGLYLSDISANGYQAQMGFFEIAGYGLAKYTTTRAIGFKVKSGAGALSINGVMVTGMQGPYAWGIDLETTGLTGNGLYVEANGPTQDEFPDIGIRVYNCNAVTLNSPWVTGAWSYGFWCDQIAYGPVILNSPGFGNPGQSNVPATPVYGNFMVIGPGFYSNWVDKNISSIVWRGGQIGGYWVYSFDNGDTTPSVMNIGPCKTSNGSATTITAFDDGVSGQVIHLQAGDANTTIKHGTNIFLKGAADKTLALNETITLCKFGNSGTRWDEI